MTRQPVLIHLRSAFKTSAALRAIPLQAKWPILENKVWSVILRLPKAFNKMKKGQWHTDEEFDFIVYSLDIWFPSTWSTWPQPCIEMIPWLLQFHANEAFIQWSFLLMHASKDILNLPTLSLHLCSLFNKIVRTRFTILFSKTIGSRFTTACWVKIQQADLLILGQD